MQFGRSPRGLVTGLVVLHVAYMLFLAPTIFWGDAQGDVPLYRQWAVGASHGYWPVVDFPWVYPAGALIPIMVPLAFGAWNYQLLWLLMMAAANVFAVWALTDGLRRRSAYAAAWYWLLIELLLSPVSMLRLEGIAAPLAIGGLIYLVRRPAVAGALIAAATWIKVWPVAIAIAAVTASSRRIWVIIGGLVTSGIIAATIIVAGGGSQLFSFVTIQGDRALQLEAPIATPWLWASVLGIPGSYILENVQLATREVVGVGSHTAGSIVGMVMAAAVATIVVLMIRARRRTARSADRALAEQRLIILGSFALAAALIVFNKVGSPQYMLWLAPIVTVGLVVDPTLWRRPAQWMVAISIATTLVFPIFYMPLVDGDPMAATILLARNAMVVGLFIWSIVALVSRGSYISAR